jgi:hypothetical protein
MWAVRGNGDFLNFPTGTCPFPSSWPKLASIRTGVVQDSVTLLSTVFMIECKLAYYGSAGNHSSEQCLWAKLPQSIPRNGLHPP